MSGFYYCGEVLSYSTQSPLAPSKSLRSRILSFYAEFVVHLVLKCKVEGGRCAQRIGNFGDLGIHFKKFLNLPLRDDATGRESVARYAIGFACNRKIYF